MTTMAPCLRPLGSNEGAAGRNRRDACALVRRFGDGEETTVAVRLVEAILCCLDDERFEGGEGARFAEAASIARAVDPSADELAMDGFDRKFFELSGVEPGRDAWETARAGIRLEMFAPYAGYRRADSVHREEAARAAAEIFAKAERAVNDAARPTGRP